MTATQTAYVVMCGIAWWWGLAQLRFAIREGRYWPPPWRLTAAVWLLTKAGFLTFLGYAAWDVIPDYPYAVWPFALVHLATFSHWLALPPERRPVTPNVPMEER